jgi:hypothetical protein
VLALAAATAVGASGADHRAGAAAAGTGFGSGCGMGHVRVTCNRCHDQFRQTVFYEPTHDRGAPAAYRLDDRTRFPALSASATTARATATAAGRSGAATKTTQMICLAVCALTTLAFLRDAAWLAAAAKAAGSG